MPVGAPSERLIHINPLLHGIDGARDLAASGISYFFAKTIDPRNIDLAPLVSSEHWATNRIKERKRALGGLIP